MLRIRSVCVVRGPLSRGWLLLTLGVLVGAPVAARARQAPQAPAAIHAAQRTGTLTGFVEDANGDGVVGAKVTLSRAGTPSRTVLVVLDGSFELTGVPAGEFRLTVTAPGFAPATAAGLLQSGEVLDLQPIELKAGEEENVDVTISRKELAQVEVRAEEQQRLLGLIPNFFVVYDWAAPPLTTKEKFDLSWKSIIDPASLVITAGIAGIQQATDSLSGYGEGARGYGKRLGAGLGDLTFGTIVGGAILPSLLHQDPRYFYKGTGSIHARLFYALSTAVICRGDNGRWQPNYSGIGGDLAAGAISNIYYPSSNRDGVKLTIGNGLLNAGYDGLQNVVQEFLLKHFTPKLPNYGNAIIP